MALIENGFGYARMDGKMLRGQRDDQIRRFINDDDTLVFITTLKCGGLGLNLTVAHRVSIAMQRSLYGENVNDLPGVCDRPVVVSGR